MEKHRKQTIKLPTILIKPRCPKHPGTENITVGQYETDAYNYVEFYCKHCKTIYVYYGQIINSPDGNSLAFKIIEKEKLKIKSILDTTDLKVLKIE